VSLFISRQTQEQWIKNLKENIRKWGKQQNFEVPKGLSIFNGNLVDIGNCLLFILPPFHGKKMYNNFHENTLRNLCTEFDIRYYFMTYCFPFTKDPVTSSNIKSYGSYIREIIELLNPKMIAIVGENTQNSLLSHKHLLKEHHGEIVTTQDRPISLLYPSDYYIKRTRVEDKSYKFAIKDNDFGNLSKEWKKLCHYTTSNVEVAEMKS